jgi:hypothetical protein
VELCLRLRQRGKLICHNDLIALHHHGYTRLTGREPGMLIHHINNQERLANQVGLWLKHQFWCDLRAGTHDLSGETLTIGLATGPLQEEDNAALNAVLALAEKLESAWPHARLLILSADRHWQQVQDCHVMLALHPAYDLRQLQQPRTDLRTACVITDAEALAAWQLNPTFENFDRYLVLDNKLTKKHPLPTGKVLRATAAKPLGDLLDDKLRVSLRGTKEAFQSPLARRLKQELLDTGALVYEQYLDGKSFSLKVSEVVVTLFDASLAALFPHYAPPKMPASLSILALETAQLPLNADALAHADEIWLTQKSLVTKLRAHADKLWQPDKTERALVSRLQQDLEKKLGRSVHTP